VGRSLARFGVVLLTAVYASRVAAEDLATFLTALWAHVASYTTGLFGGLVTAWRVWHSRQADGP